MEQPTLEKNSAQLANGSNRLFAYILMLLAFVADQATKWWATAFLAEHGSMRVNSLLTIRETYNRGLAFGLFQGLGPLVGWLSIFIILGLVVYLRRWPRTAYLPRFGLALLIGGALGNLVDRILFGRVLDFIQTPIRSGVFNVADVLIQVGVLLLILGILRDDRTTANVPPVSAEQSHLE